MVDMFHQGCNIEQIDAALALLPQVEDDPVTARARALIEEHSNAFKCALDLYFSPGHPGYGQRR
jgi:hypothetical protein